MLQQDPSPPPQLLYPPYLHTIRAPAIPATTYRCECAAAWAGVALAAGGWWHDAPVGHNHNVLAAELLLKLTNQPLLDLVEVPQQPEGDLQGETAGKGAGGHQQRPGY